MPDIEVIPNDIYGQPTSLLVIVTEANWEMPREYALSVAAQRLTSLGYGSAHAVASRRQNPHTWELTYTY